MLSEKFQIRRAISAAANATFIKNVFIQKCLIFRSIKADDKIIDGQIQHTRPPIKRVHQPSELKHIHSPSRHSKEKQATKSCCQTSKPKRPKKRWFCNSIYLRFSHKLWQIIDSPIGSTQTHRSFVLFFFFRSLDSNLWRKREKGDQSWFGVCLNQLNSVYFIEFAESLERFTLSCPTHKTSILSRALFVRGIYFGSLRVSVEVPVAQRKEIEYANRTIGCDARGN